jgi:hypothetical protein
MFLTDLKTALAAAFFTLCLYSSGSCAEPPQTPRAAKLDLTADTCGTLHALIRPHDDEWRHLKVEWLTDVVAARKKAASEDKPIVTCYTGGAGYNEPLGTC